MENYNEYLKALREAKGLSLREVERLTEVSNAYLSQLESGKIKQPSPNTLYKLADCYGIGYDTLMEKVGYPTLRIEEGRAEYQKSSQLAARIGNISSEEEMELLEYLKFIRNRRK